MNAVNTKTPCFTYIIQGANGNKDRTVTVYKPTMAYFLIDELVKFRRFPAFFPDIGIIVLSENEPPSDILTIYNIDGTITEVEHPFDALKQCEEHNK
jgi:hypothetical protein